MIINNNIPALNTHRQMGINQSAMQNSMEKLSSGLRINRAGDDAAGLAISEKMRAQINGLQQASRNAQDGISMIQTAEGALNETHDILQRMRELATQSANDTNVDVDREEIQKEINQLTSEINRIGNTTEFNTRTLLDGSQQNNSATGTHFVGEDSDVLALSDDLQAALDGLSAGSYELTTQSTDGLRAEETLIALGSSVTFSGSGTAGQFKDDQIIVDAAGFDQAKFLFGDIERPEVASESNFNVFSTGDVSLTDLSGATSDTAVSFSINYMMNGSSGSVNVNIAVDSGDDLSSGDIRSEIISVLGNVDGIASVSGDGDGFEITLEDGSQFVLTGVSNLDAGSFNSGTVDQAELDNLESSNRLSEFTANSGEPSGVLTITTEGGSIDVNVTADMFAGDLVDAINNAIEASEDVAGTATLNDGTLTITGGTFGDGTSIQLSSSDFNVGDDLGFTTATSEGSDGNAATFTIERTSEGFRISSSGADSIVNENVSVSSDTFTFNGYGLSFELSDFNDMLVGDTFTFETVPGEFSEASISAAQPDVTISDAEIGQAFQAIDISSTAAEGDYSFSYDHTEGTLQVVFSGTGGDEGKQFTETVDVSNGVTSYNENGISFTFDPSVLSDDRTASFSLGERNITNLEAVLTNTETGVSETFTLQENYDGESADLTNFDLNGLMLTGAIGTGETFTFEVGDGDYGTDSSLNFQIGANQNQALNISIADMRAEALGISSTSLNSLTFTNRDGEEETVNLTDSSDVTDGTNAVGAERGLDVSSHENATKAITVINNAIERVSAERSMLGATQNRLEHTISNLDNSAENLSAAESRIRDVDMASEMMEMTRANILSQASQSMLAQANQQPQSVLQLLG